MSESESGPCAATAIRSARPPGELHRQPTELRCERDERAEHLEVARIDDRDVDGVRDDTTLECGDDLLGDDHPGAVLRLVGGGREMWRHDDLVELEQRAGVRLGREHVEGGTGHLAGADPFDQRLLVDERAAGGVDDPDAVAHRRDRLAIDHPARLVAERRVERDHVGDAVDVVERGGVLDPELAEAIVADERVERDDAHPETERPPGDLLADPAEADDAKRLAVQLHPTPARALPPALLERGVRLRDVPRERDHQPDRLLGCRDHGRLGRVGDDDSSAGRCFDVDVVDTDPGAADHLEPLGAADELGCELRRRADHDAVVPIDDLLDRRLLVDVDLEARPQKLDPRLGDRLSNENAHGHRTAASYARPRGRRCSPGLELDTDRSQLGLERVEGKLDLADPDVTDVAEPEEAVDDVTVPAGDRDPVSIAQREP